MNSPRTGQRLGEERAFEHDPGRADKQTTIEVRQGVAAFTFGPTPAAEAAHV
jgi:hypothetical protein